MHMCMCIYIYGASYTYIIIYLHHPSMIQGALSPSASAQRPQRAHSVLGARRGAARREGNRENMAS